MKRQVRQPEMNLVSALVGALLASAAIAQEPPREDHLQPENSVFGHGGLRSETNELIAAFLPEPIRHVQMMVFPSWDPPWVVYVSRAGDQPPLVATGPDADLVVFAKRGTGTTAMPRFETKNAPIDERTLAALEDLWTAALVDVSASDGNILTLDGTGYHFADFARDYGYRTGQFSSPSAGTKVDDLVRVGTLLFEYAGAPPNERIARADELRRKSRAARIRFVGDGPAGKTKGRILISSAPPGARVLLDGADTKLTTPTRLDLEGNTVHDVAFQLAGFRDAQRTGVRVQPAVERSVRVELVPQWVKIQLSSKPSGARVSIDGVEVCVATPCDIARRPEDGYPIVHLTKAGCDPYQTTVVIEPVLELPYEIRMRCP
ncbi:MAG: PEGA domain-containing protein [Deltaproteobacteria bacterium]|nr:PEGA domain-containing protein [Deltaproteobacteria bacterium]